MLLLATVEFSKAERTTSSNFRCAYLTTYMYRTSAFRKVSSTHLQHIRIRTKCMKMNAPNRRFCYLQRHYLKPAPYEFFFFFFRSGIFRATANIGTTAPATLSPSPPFASCSIRPAFFSTFVFAFPMRHCDVMHVRQHL